MELWCTFMWTSSHKAMCMSSVLLLRWLLLLSTASMGGFLQVTNTPIMYIVWLLKCLLSLGTGKQIVVQYIPESAYYVKFPAAQGAIAPLK